MATLVLEIRPGAEEDAAVAVHWYSVRSSRVARKFADEFEQALREIVEAPTRWRVFAGRTRGYVMKRFPYTVFYWVEDDRVVVAAVAHHKRRPGYWTSQ